MLPIADPQRFVGRHRQLVSLSEAFDTRSRLVTLTGASGVGKSRLAAEHLHNVSGERAVLAVDLSEVDSARDALAMLASAISAPATAGRDPVSVLADTLRELGPATLVIDHADDLIEALRVPVARFMTAAPELHLLVTSGRPLSIEDEQVFPLEPLALPVDAGERAPSDALRLWQLLRSNEQQKAPKSADSELVRLLRALAGLPLTIELVSALAEHLTPYALVERLGPALRDLGVLPSPQAVLSAVLEAVWSACSEAERLAFAQCAVFAASFDAQAYAGVCALGSVKGAESAELMLERLVQRRLVARLYTTDGALRYGLHDGIREYARRRLDKLDPKHDAVRRHARLYVARGTSLADALEGPEGPEATRSLKRDQANLLAIARRNVPIDDAEANTLRLKALCIHDHLLSNYGPVDNDLARLDVALDPARASHTAPSVWLEALCVRAFVHARSSNRERCFADLEQAKAMAARAPHAGSYDAGRVAVTCAFVHLSAGDLAAARAEAERALAIAEAVGHTRLQGIVLGVYALIRRTQGDESEAEALYERALLTHRQIANRRFEGIVETRLAQLCWAHGRLERALELADHARTIHRMFGDRAMEGLCLVVRGSVTHAQASLEAARLAFEAAEPLLSAVGDQRQATLALNQLGRIRCELGDFETARSAFDRALKGFAQLGAERDALMCLARARALDAVLGDRESAEAALRAIEPRDDDPVLIAAIETVRAQLDLADVRRARGRGDRAAVHDALAQAKERAELARQKLAPDQLTRFSQRHDVEVGLRILERALVAHEREAPAGERALRLPLHGKWFESPRGERVDCSTRPAMRRILVRLAYSALRGEAHSFEPLELFAAGWPYEHPGEENARLQVFAVLASLRKAIGEALVADEQGHRLSATLAMELVEH